MKTNHQIQKDAEAYTQGGGICYTCEAGEPYTRADFVQLANGEERVAKMLFDRCYWQYPETLLLEELRDCAMKLPILCHHTKSQKHWLRLHPGADPLSEKQCALLRVQQWQQETPDLWVKASQNITVPYGIAYVDGEHRDRTPQEEAEYLAELGREERNLTPQAQKARAAFVARMNASLTKAATTTTYYIDQLPKDAHSWKMLEESNGQGLRTLFLGHLAETEEELWQALDRLDATCEFTVTQLDQGKGRFQIKGTKHNGNICDILARETESSLLQLMDQMSARINQEPLRDRLLRRWTDLNTVRAERIKQEQFHLEILPFLAQRSPELHPNEESERTTHTQNLLTLEAVQTIYRWGIRRLEALSATMAQEDAQTLLIEIEQHLQTLHPSPAPTTEHDITVNDCWNEGRQFAYENLAGDIRRTFGM